MKKLLISLFFISPLFAHEITGKVIHVSDGDTVTIMTSDHNKHKIRLASIDAPERNQPFGKKSKQMLAKMIASQSVVAKCTGKDRYKRNICTIFGTLTNKGTTDINAMMVANGGAWVYRKYYKGTDYYQLEEQAKAAKRGLWETTEAQAIPPWEWRHGVNNDTNEPQVKLSKSKICHDKGAKYYNRVKRYKGFESIDKCLRIGRLPKG